MTPAPSSPLFRELLAGAVLALLGAFVLFLRATARIDLRRSVLVRVPLLRSWQAVRNLPWLLSRHLKLEGHGGIDEWVLREGDGAAIGSLWRGVGRWNGDPYWVDIELAIARPESQLAITLRRDSLGTHLRVREHLGSLTLEGAGPEATKLTWHLRSRLIGLRARLERCVRSRRLWALLLDLSLRSTKADLEREFESETKALLLAAETRTPADRIRWIASGPPRAGGSASLPDRPRVSPDKPPE
jgi:hypothetical protein